MPKRMRWVVLSLIAAAMIVVGIYISFRFVTEQNLAAKLAQTRKPRTIDAYERLFARIHGEQDSEHTPQTQQQDATKSEGLPEDAEDILAGYKRLFSLMDARGFGAEDIEARQKRLLDRLEEHSPGNGSGGVMPDMAPEDLVLSRDRSMWSDAEISKVEDLLLANQDLIAEIRRMAERGGPVYPLDFSETIPIFPPHHTPLSRCVLLLGTDAFIKAMRNRPCEAVDNIIAGMKLGDALAQEPLTTSHLRRIVFYGVMNDALRDSFGGSDLSPQLTARLMTHIAQADNRHAFAESLAGERYLVHNTFRYIRDASHWSLSPSPLSYPLYWLYESPLGRPWVNMDEEAYTDLTNRFISVAELPYYEPAPELDRIERDIENMPASRRGAGVFSHPMLYSFPTQARHEATLDLMQMGILIEQYEAREGCYPESLDAIAPALGGGLPVDPFTGEPYQYRLSEDVFLLYSVGQNLTDDGGRHHYRDGDWVWRGPSPRGLFER